MFVRNNFGGKGNFMDSYTPHNKNYGGYNNYTGYKTFRGPQSNKKHSGCKRTDHTRDGVKKDIISGWKYTRKNGLVSFVAVPAKQKYQTQKDPKKYVKMVAKITSTFGQKIVWCLWNNDKKILLFMEMKMVASPSQNYWSFLKPKR